MKNINLKFCFAIIFSLATCSLKAQSLQQRHQNDMDQRKKHVNAVLLKAKEQQMQQRAEKTNEVNRPQSTAPIAVPNSQPLPAQPIKNEIKPALRPSVKKQVAKQQAVPVTTQQ